jgi:hypothetical protein
MARVTVARAMSLDGYIAGPNDREELPLGEGGAALFDWYFHGDTPAGTATGSGSPSPARRSSTPRSTPAARS